MLEKLAYSGVLGSVGLSMKKSLQVRLNRRVTFDRRIEVPSPSFFNKKGRKKYVCRLAN